MEKLSGMRTILISLIAMNGLWVVISALNVVGISLYEIIPGTIFSLLTSISNLVELIFYVLLLGMLPALARSSE